MAAADVLVVHVAVPIHNLQGKATYNNNNYILYSVARLGSWRFAKKLLVLAAANSTPNLYTICAVHVRVCESMTGNTFTRVRYFTSQRGRHQLERTNGC